MKIPQRLAVALAFLLLPTVALAQPGHGPISGGGSGAGVTGLTSCAGGTALADDAILRGDGTTACQGSTAIVGDDGGLILTGTVATDLPTYSAEFLLTTGWTSTNWTGSWAAGWDHTTGNTTALSQSKAAVSGTKYQISYTVTGYTSGTFMIAFGGQTLATLSATGAWGPTTISTASLVITPTTDFDGAIVVSIKSITAGSSPLLSLKSSDGTIRASMRANSSLGNTFIGHQSGQYNTTGSSNSAQGYQALSADTTGYGNSAQGYQALGSNTTGYGNSAQGYQALNFNTTGSGNSAQGYQALGSNTTSNNNSAQGYYALVFNTTGSYNSALGSSSGSHIADGATANATSGTSTFLGALTKASANGVANETVLGYGAIGSGSNTVTLGNTSVLGVVTTAGLYATKGAAPTIASATTIAPTKGITFISGTTAVVTITAPVPISAGGGQITLIPTGVWATTTGGNIALATTAVVSKALIMTWDVTAAKWYPSY